MKTVESKMISPEELMIEFTQETGIRQTQIESNPDRYLWTDAFAVCNFLDLYNKTGNNNYKELTISLINQVHLILGKHRKDDTRSGWLASEQNPTSNGLRIGKPSPERGKNERYDSIAEWQKDGQYFHYLTKWIHALYKAWKVLKKGNYIQWSIELAKASLRFITDKRMYWKMSIDLSRPLVGSMGQHDPIDGYVTFQTIESFDGSQIKEGIAKFKKIMNHVNIFTSDPLGLGGFLFDIYRLYQLNRDKELQQKLIDVVAEGMEGIHLNHQLAFRELGLSIGLSAAKKMKSLSDYWYLIDQINSYWVKNRNWREHKNINQVMLATSLSPEGFLDL